MAQDLPGPTTAARARAAGAEPYWEPMSGNEWADRIAYAQAVHSTFDDTMGMSDAAIDAGAQAWLNGVDTTEFVGSRHHVVPRFLLDRWANDRSQVRVHRRVENRLDVCNIGDLAIKDFYTVIDTQGRKNSAMESLIGVVEKATAPIISDLLSSLPTAPITAQDVFRLAQFASFQAVRTPRRRREVELTAEYHYKLLASGHVPEEELREITVAPHQNELVDLTTKAAETVMPFFACRPLALMRLDAPRLLICDEPVVLNAPVDAFHHADCFLTDEEVEARMQHWQRKTKKRKRGRHPPPGRVVHFASTAPAGFGTADEVLLAISPTTALLWGPLQQRPALGPVERVRLVGAEADRFAEMANTAMTSQALDWVAGRVADTTFDDRKFPPVGPLMKVCDGVNAASLAVNETPTRFRPVRLWVPDEAELAAAAKRTAAQSGRC